MSSFTSFSPCDTDVDDGTKWYSPKLLLRFPDADEMAGWPQDQFIIPEDEESSKENIISAPYSPIPFDRQVEGVHRPYPDGCWEFESFFRHVIDGNRLRLRTIWANGETTDTVAYNFKDNLDMVEEYIGEDLKDHPTRKIGAIERYLWFDELGIDFDEVRLRSLTKEIDEKAIVPLFSLNSSEDPHYYKTPRAEDCKQQKDRRVPNRPNVGYRTPRVDHDLSPGLELAETPKVRAKEIRRMGDVNEKLQNVN